jgi:hypothetical protein
MILLKTIIIMKAKKKNHNHPQEDQPTRSTLHPGSTTQGGSNFGQGSSQLSKDSYKQGNKAGKGSNYEHEQGWNNEALRREDMEDQ